jgi:anti-sigma28 factor (negative regulator of flagellin synthesis)
MATGTAAPIGRSIVNQETPLVLDIHRWILKSGQRDVRWEKVESIKRILTAGMYSVPPKQVAARLLERMLEHDRANHRWKRSRSGTTNVSSGINEALLAGNSETAGSKPNARNRVRQTGITGKVTCRGTLGGQEVTGWRYVEDATRHVKDRR